MYDLPSRLFLRSEAILGVRRNGSKDHSSSSWDRSDTLPVPMSGITSTTKSHKGDSMPVTVADHVFGVVDMSASPQVFLCWEVTYGDAEKVVRNELKRERESKLATDRRRYAIVRIFATAENHDDPIKWVSYSAQV
jgi:hypothetical protein